MPAQITTRRRAAAILAAWDARDMRGLKTALAHAAGGPAQADAAESERGELLAAVAAE